MLKFKRSVALLIALGLAVISIIPGYSTVKAGEKININVATAKELQRLEGVGKAISKRIVEYREENGPFKDIEEVKKVKGIGKITFEKIKDLITVGEEGGEVSRE
ncbi:MAG: helix-hairpin-helix domain-containing protein [Thermodesulfobacteriota bacterium]